LKLAWPPAGAGWPKKRSASLSKAFRVSSGRCFLFQPQLNKAQYSARHVRGRRRLKTTAKITRCSRARAFKLAQALLHLLLQTRAQHINGIFWRANNLAL
jgi:hypothetical protein